MKRKHRCRPNLEPLEVKSLLSHMASGLASGFHGIRMPVAKAGQGSLVLGLTTNQKTYTPGQVVQMTFTESNESNHAMLVAIGPSIDGFVRPWRDDDLEVELGADSGLYPEACSPFRPDDHLVGLVDGSIAAGCLSACITSFTLSVRRPPSASSRGASGTVATNPADQSTASGIVAPVPVPIKHPMPKKPPVGRPFSTDQSMASGIVAPVPVPIKHPMPKKPPVGRPFVM